MPSTLVIPPYASVIKPGWPTHMHINHSNAQVCLALCHMHSLGVRHGDLRAANVLLDERPVCEMDRRGFTIKVGVVKFVRGINRPTPIKS